MSVSRCQAYELFGWKHHIGTNWMLMLRSDAILCSFLSIFFPLLLADSPWGTPSVPDPSQRCGRRPGTIVKSCIQLHHQQYLWGKRGEWNLLCGLVPSSVPSRAGGQAWDGGAAVGKGQGLMLVLCPTHVGG